jgi:uncharacterized protein
MIKILHQKHQIFILIVFNQIVCVFQQTLNSIAPYNDIVKFAADIGNTWGVGEYEKDNGIVVLICKPCRNIGIAVGTGIEDVLTDEICKEIIQKTMIPQFKTDNFYEGTFNGIIALIEKF